MTEHQASRAEHQGETSLGSFMQRTCHDCGVQPGQAHEWGCDTEQCSVCGWQRLMCDCVDHDPAFAGWTGFWPCKLEAQALGLDLNELAASGIHHVLSKKPHADGMARQERDTIEVPPDTDATRLVEAILEKAQAPGGEDRHLFRIRLALIHDNAERLAGLLERRDEEREELVAALTWALPYLAEVPLPPDNQRQRDRYAGKLNAAERVVRAARGGA